MPKAHAAGNKVTAVIGAAVLQHIGHLPDEAGGVGDAVRVAVGHDVAEGAELFRTQEEGGDAPAPLALVAFVDAKGRLQLMNAAGVTRQVKGAKKPSLPAWSEDGRRLAFVQAAGQSRVRVTGCDLRQVARPFAAERDDVVTEWANRLP